MKLAQKKDSYGAITLSENKGYFFWRKNEELSYTYLNSTRVKI